MRQETKCWWGFHLFGKWEYTVSYWKDIRNNVTHAKEHRTRTCSSCGHIKRECMRTWRWRTK